MGWVTLSLRKMVMTQRVSDLEHRLVTLSQAQQSLASGSAYSQRALGIRKQEEMKSLMGKYSSSFTSATNVFTNGSASTQDLIEYTSKVQSEQIDFMYQKMMLESIFTLQEQELQDAVNTKQTNLDMQQEQVETQLEAARAELEQLDEAVSNDIENSTISLT